MQQENQNLSREQRRAQIRAAKRRKIRALCLLAAVAAAGVILAVFITKAVATSRDAGFSQIGPFPPAEGTAVERVKQEYDWASPVPEAEPVEDSFFSSALIIGDTRAEGMDLYLESCPAQVIASQSMTAQNALESMTSIEDALSRGRTSVYIMLGLNEAGWAYPELYGEYLEQLVEALRGNAPESSVYICSLIPLTASAASSRGYLTAELVAELDSLAQQVAQRQQAYYLDLSEVLAPEGFLADSYAEANGLSLNKSGYEALYNYLKTHTVDKELYK